MIIKFADGTVETIDEATMKDFGAQLALQEAFEDEVRCRFYDKFIKPIKVIGYCVAIVSLVYLCAHYFVKLVG